ncbi:unnamed protein product [Vitrella brassicaformis CCMP3155]|uniref:Uncharacterized protein n=1 Tax=Vitrella brassicaformis (strain CCMP3155) TaxID=1169540 RepID=A0A0G4EBE9_VITBC|nr:unnamed protein product [Vitrella brassicaformis CCMP3155]|eukprot:CEL92592.1 unnamed protein product [Vitrella brassicaformis CCMP3155]
MAPSLRLEDICIEPFPDNSDATKQLVQGVVRRTFTHQQQVTQLIQQRGADPNAALWLRARGSGTIGLAYRLLSLTFDNLSDDTMPTVWARDRKDSNHRDRVRPVALPLWSSAELQTAVMEALIDGGADVDATVTRWSLYTRPIEMAIRAGNEAAVTILLARNAAVKGRDPDGYWPPYVMPLPTPMTFAHLGHQVSREYEQRLMSIYRLLIQHDATVATEQDVLGLNPIHLAARLECGHYSQAFIDSYLDLLVQHGASLTLEPQNWWTPLQDAALEGSPCVVDYLSRHLPPGTIDREGGRGDGPPLAVAAGQLNAAIEDSQDNDLPQEVRDREETKEYFSARISTQEATIRSLLRAGADIGRMEGRMHVHRQLVLPQYAAVLNEVPTAAMAAVNAALRPQRSLAAFLMKSLPTLLPHLMEPPHTGTPPANPPPLPAPPGYGPHEAEAIGWKIAAMCFDWDAALTTISHSLPFRNSTLARRVTAAAAHFVDAAMYAISSREVVGGMANLGGVTVPPLCFAINGGQHGGHRLLGLCEVVHRARLDEAAQHGIQEGAINKGFNTHFGAGDSPFQWEQLGYIDEDGDFESLDID